MTFYDVDLKAGDISANATGVDQLLNCIAIVEKLMRAQEIEHSKQCPGGDCGNPDAILFHEFTIPIPTFDSNLSNLNWDWYINNQAISLHDAKPALATKEFINIYLSEL